MKKFLKPLAVLFCAGFIASCAKNTAVTVPSDPEIKNPISDFSVTPDANDGFTFKFNSLAENFSKLEWRFGDDTLKTDTNPSHTYLATGQYVVDLETYSKTGQTSHKQVVINIAPDSVMQISTAKTGVDGQLKFNANVKGNIQSIAWTFNAVDPSTSVVTKTTSSDLNPVVSFAFGSFNSFSVTATTDKGSVVTISRNVTTEGIVTDITQSRINWSSTNDNTGNANENASKLIDGNPDTKFGFYAAFPVPQIFQLQFAYPITVKLYAIENGNDSESTRDPKEWVLEASNDGNTWDIVDHQTLTIGFADYLKSIGQSATRYKRFFYYPIANPKPYSMYQWRIISTFGNAMQIEELRLYK
ncbi:PKD domain-containing protein [Mucilaginibacter panaciglaebae]